MPDAPKEIYLERPDNGFWFGMLSTGKTPTEVLGQNGKRYVDGDVADRLAEMLRRCCDQKLGWYDDARLALSEYDGSKDG